MSKRLKEILSFVLIIVGAILASFSVACILLPNDAIDYGKFADDVELIMNWKEEDKAPELSEEFKIARSIRIINIDENETDDSLNKFDKVVFNIESSFIKEIKGCKIQDAWKGESDERTCSACDFKTFCKNNSVKTKDIKIP